MNPLSSFSLVLLVNLLSFGCAADSVNYADFFNAVNSSDLPALKKQIADGIDINHVFTEHGDSTALHLAIKMKKDKIVDFLLEQKNIDVNKKNKLGYSPLLLATKYGMSGSQVILPLLNHSADINATVGKAGFKAIHMAILSKDMDSRMDAILDLLFGLSSDPNTIDMELFKQVNFTTGTNKTPMLLAAQVCDYELTMLFLNAGSDKNFRDNIGETVLHKAARSCPGYDLIKELLLAGVDTTILNAKNQTAKMCAEKNNALKGTKEDNITMFDTIKGNKDFVGSPSFLVQKMNEMNDENAPQDEEGEGEEDPRDEVERMFMGGKEPAHDQGEEEQQDGHEGQDGAQDGAHEEL